MTGALMVTNTAAGVIQTEEKNFWAIVDAWLEDIKKSKNRKARTLEVYRYNLGVFKSWLDAELIEQPTRQNIKDWKEFMKAKKYSVATINLYLATVRSFYKWLADNYGVNNVAAGIDGLKRSKEHTRGVLNLADMKTLLNVVVPTAEKKIAAEKERLEAAQKEAQSRGKSFHINGLMKRYEKAARLQALRDKAILAVLMGGALRTIEVSRLTIADFKRNGGVTILSVLGKGKDAKVDVKISRQVANTINQWLSAREAVDVVTNNSPLFCSIGNNSWGETLGSHAVSTLVKFYLEQAGLKNKNEISTTDCSRIQSKPVTAHSLRASLATESYFNGAKITEIQQQLRHENLETTMIYIREADKLKNPCSDIISAAIFG